MGCFLKIKSARCGKFVYLKLTTYTKMCFFFFFFAQISASESHDYRNIRNLNKEYRRGVGRRG